MVTRNFSNNEEDKKNMVRTTTNSWDKYEESLSFLPAGSSTNSKAPKLKPEEPALIVRGNGCRVYDVDGNEYIDYRNGLGPVSLGYNIPEVNNAIIEQLNNGIIFGQPHPLEGEVAEMLVEMIPCAEKVRFLKTGGEAIAACIKIARNATNRNVVLQCGYNGWLNSLSLAGNLPPGIAVSQPTRGVPPELAKLHRSLPWGDVDKWQKTFDEYGKDIAAVVIACSYLNIERGKEFLPAIRKLTKDNGTLMIMDEIVTGFRLAIGGAHEYFGIDPDMAVFAKGLANGMPLSVYTGKKELIDSAPKIAISSTFGGETLSLAAVKAVLKIYKEQNVVNHLWTMGKHLWTNVNELLKKYNVKAVVSGYPVCPQFVFEKPEEQEKFFRRCYANGVSFYLVSYVNFSHKQNDVDETLARVEQAMKNSK